MKKIWAIAVVAAAAWSGAGRISGQGPKPVFPVREISSGEATQPAVYLSRPSALAFDQENVFVLDARDNEVKAFFKDGRFHFSFGSKGQAPGEFNGPCDMCILGDKIYIADGANRRIQIVDKKGRYLSGFNTGFFPWRILALEEDRIVAVPLPSGRARGDKALHCFDSRGALLWRALDSRSSGDSTLEAMENQISIRKGRGGEFFALRLVNDGFIRRLDASGALLAETEIAADYPFRDIAVPGLKGRKKTLRGLCWNYAVDGGKLYLIVPEYTEDQDLGPGRRIALVSPTGQVEAFIDLPDKVSRIAVEGERIYGIDLDYRLRLFALEKR